MMLAAVMPTLRPSIWLASWAARSSQRSARAGDAADIVNSSASNAQARPLDRTTDVRNAIRLVMNTPAPLKLARKIHASAQPRPGTVAAAVLHRRGVSRKRAYSHLPLWASE